MPKFPFRRRAVREYPHRPQLKFDPLNQLFTSIEILGTG